MTHKENSSPETGGAGFSATAAATKLQQANPAAGQAADPTAPDRCPLVVGIGASAGGQEALEQLFTAMPADCGLSFVVVIHLPPAGPSYLAEILGRYTTMAVVTAEEGMELVPNRVQVIPAGSDLIVSGGRLRLEEPGERGGLHHPIDRLFGSLAAELKAHAVAVVLSGYGMDGAAGVKAVREADGIVIVQEPGSALTPAMPRSAIATGAADFILPAEEMPAKIAEIARGTCPLPSRSCRTITHDEELQTIFTLVKHHTGHDFSSYKTNTVMRRIERRMSVNDMSGLGKYIAFLRETPREAHALCQDILIGVTSFFRDPDAFATLRREVIPQLFAGRDADEPVRIWHACCATGEEVYSMAILIREYLDEERIDARVQLFASDIDQVAVAQARAGLYGDDIEADVGEKRLKTFFTRSDGRWQVAKQLREMIVFAHHSLIKDPPFSRLDLLVCRNFLIYLNSDMQKRVVALFHQALKPGGFLFLGAAETVGQGADLFTPVDKKWKIFARPESNRRAEMLFPFTAPVRKPPVTGRSPRPAGSEEPGPGAVAEKLLMERYSPPCVVVNEKYEVVHVSTRANRFLEVPVGEPTRDILRMAREELRPALRAAIYKAFAENTRMVFRGVKIDTDGGEETVNVLVEPITASSAGKLAMVIFEPAPMPVAHLAPGGSEDSVGDETSRDILIRQLEEQLSITHEQLRAVTEQLESTHDGFMSANEELMSINEEFQSGNEELQSTNEELETSKEELQALNEELVTVNAELQGKVEELDRANSDIENLLKSSEIATIFLDRQMHIKGFTPAVSGIFNLIQADTGRPFRHFAGKIDWPTFTHDVETVLAGQPFAEQEVATLSGDRCYLKRIFPYRNAEGGIDGIVVTFIDITERKLSDETLAKASEQRRLALEAADLGAWDYDFNSGDVFWDECCRNTWGIPAGSRIDYSEAIDRIHPDDRTATDEAVKQALSGTDGGAYHREFRVVWPDGSLHWVASHGRVYFEGEGEERRAVRFVGTNREITNEKRAEETLRRYELLAGSSRDIILFVRRDDGRILEANAAATTTYGYSRGEMVGMALRELRAPDTLELTADQMAEADAHGILFETVHCRKDGSCFPVEVSSQGATIGGTRTLISVIRDITERKRAEEIIQRHVEELRASNEDLERFNSASVGRELRMIELKKEINELCGQAGLESRYPLDFEKQQS